MTGLSVRNVSYVYCEKRTLDDVSLHVAQGAFCALLGPNGAGKSTLFSLLTRLFTTAQGAIEIAGFDISKQPRQALAQIGVVFQQPTLDLDLDLTVHRNLSYFAALHGLSSRTADSRIAAALDRLNMAERARERTRDLNGGHRRRLEIARCLIHSPSVLLLDEPTVGLDAAARAAITSHVHRLSAEDGLTVLWSTHLTDEIGPDDEVAILHRGKVLKQELCRDITKGKPLQQVFLSMTRATA